MIDCIDLFCGLGGLTHGLAQGGVHVVAGIDVDGQSRFAYEQNNPAVFIEQDVRKLSGTDLRNLFVNKHFTLLAGCAPCQPFSSYSRTSHRSKADPKWELVAQFARLIRESKPDLLTMENVPQLQDHSVFRVFLDSLAGYHVWHAKVDCSEYGIPQTRKRLVVLASRLGPITLLSPKALREQGKKTVRAAIAHLPVLAAGESDRSDGMHTACKLSPLNLRRIRSSRPGGTWRDWPPNLVASCHRKRSGTTYPSVYGRMEWDAPSPTITTQCFGYGNGRFGHPEQDRAITLREAAILQTFPQQYRFLPEGEHVKFSVLGRLIGNAVPVRLGQAIARSFQHHIQRPS